jgi:tRNA(Ile)-lysidine synthase
VSGPHPAVAAVRRAVRHAVADIAREPVGVALSGGADSTALLAATCFAYRRGPAVTALIADQHWHDESTAVAERAAALATKLGANAIVLDAPSARDEAAARQARYAVLGTAAAERDLAAVLLGHTRDDQAETVLLGLARGSGARSLAGMARRRGRYRRPLLDLPRSTTRAACTAAGLPVYEDPANGDLAFVRSRLRHAALPALADALGRDVGVNLARSARLLRDDADLLDELAASALAECVHANGALDAAAAAQLVPALRRRVLRRWCTEAAGAAVSFAQVDAVDALVTDWHGQGAVSLAGGTRVTRDRGSIAVVPVTDRP